MARQPAATMARRILLASLALMAASGAWRQSLAASAPPPFYSEGGQFISLRPAPYAPSRPIRTAGGSVIDFPALKGKVVVVNFWATWCPPCVAEMPSLDRLAASLHNAPVVVMPIAMDTTGKSAVAAFYARFGLSHLRIYSDPDQQVGHVGGSWQVLFPLYGLPTTYLIDRHGRVLGYVPGAAKWDSPQAHRLIAWLAAN